MAIMAALSMAYLREGERNIVWGDEDTTSVTEIKLSGSKVLVPFKRKESGLAEIQVSLNGVPFNM